MLAALQHDRRSFGQTHTGCIYSLPSDSDVHALSGDQRANQVFVKLCLWLTGGVLLQERQKQQGVQSEKERVLAERLTAAEAQVCSLQALLQPHSRADEPTGETRLSADCFIAVLM